MVKWKIIAQQKGYRVWRRGNLNTKHNQVAVYKGIFMTTTSAGETRSYRTKNMTAGIKRARAYMKRMKK